MDLGAVHDYPRPSQSLPLRPRALQARPDPLAYTPALETGHERKDRSDQLPEFGRGVEEALGVGAELDALRAEAPQVIECLADTLARKTIQTPHQYGVELAPGSSIHERLELRPVLLALGSGLAIYILRDDTPVQRLGERDQLLALVLRGLLATILRNLAAYTEI